VRLLTLCNLKYHLKYCYAVRQWSACVLWQIFIREGCLQKLSRKGLQQRIFFLVSCANVINSGRLLTLLHKQRVWSYNITLYLYGIDTVAILNAAGWCKAAHAQFSQPFAHLLSYVNWLLPLSRKTIVSGHWEQVCHCFASHCYNSHWTSYF